MPLFAARVGYVHVFMYVPIHVGAWVHACAFVWNLKAENKSLSP